MCPVWLHRARARAIVFWCKPHNEESSKCRNQESWKCSRLRSRACGSSITHASLCACICIDWAGCLCRRNCTILAVRRRATLFLLEKKKRSAMFSTFLSWLWGEETRVVRFRPLPPILCEDAIVGTCPGPTEEGGGGYSCHAWARRCICLPERARGGYCRRPRLEGGVASCEADCELGVGGDVLRWILLAVEALAVALKRH